VAVDAATLRDHLDYSAWASQRQVAAARELTQDELTRNLRSSHESVLGTLAHIYGADRIWLSRVQEKPRGSMFDPGEQVTLDMLEREWPLLYGRWVQWLAGLGEAAFATIVTYRTLEGVEYRTPLGQVILHVVNHGSYHRGQVSAMLRQLGRKPPATDLIAYYRSSASR
jgi:uncharacterized damage-inducible protein DinB